MMSLDFAQFLKFYMQKSLENNWIKNFKCHILFYNFSIALLSRIKFDFRSCECYPGSNYCH